MFNDLSFESVPTEILQLNQHELVLIQRAKAVTKMKTVAGKWLPPTQKVSKVKGLTFHLSLPLNETLKCLLSPEEALPFSRELLYTSYYKAFQQKKLFINVNTGFTMHCPS